jgi:hypothetical protein
MQEYIITAYSSAANQTQREINLMGPAPTTKLEADRWAASYALRLNQQRHLQQSDWQPRIELVGDHVRTQ